MKVLDKHQLDGGEASKDLSNMVNEAGLDKGNVNITNAPCSGPSPIQPQGSAGYYHQYKK